MTRPANQGRACFVLGKMRSSFPAPALSTPFFIPPLINSPSASVRGCKNFAAPGHAPLLHIHYSTQSLKNSRCEFSTMHRNRVATGTRQQDLSLFRSPPLPASSTTTHRPLRPRPSPFLSPLRGRRFLVNNVGCSPLVRRNLPPFRRVSTAKRHISSNNGNSEVENWQMSSQRRSLRQIDL